MGKSEMKSVRPNSPNHKSCSQMSNKAGIFSSIASRIFLTNHFKSTIEVSRVAYQIIIFVKTLVESRDLIFLVFTSCTRTLKLSLLRDALKLNKAYVYV